MNLEESLVIASTPEALFALTQDYARRLEWDPFLRSAELRCGATQAAVGVRAWCVACNGLGMETEYVSFNPPRACAVKMTRGPWLVRSFAGSWRFEEESPGRTRVTFRYQVRAVWGLTWMVARVFRRDTRKRLAALKAFVERP